MRKKNALRDMLNAFQAKKIDILIGTQMIAKGLHFPNVTLVGILNADIGLHVPDFRAGERVFQLLTQVAGRAGRGELEGEVIVQTFTPHSPSIQFARHHDFDGFAEQELEMRQQFHFPPFYPLRRSNKPLDPRTPRRIHPRNPPPPPQGRPPQRHALRRTPPQPLGEKPRPIPFPAHDPRRKVPHPHPPRPTALQQTPLPEEVTVVFDMDAWSFT